MNTTTLKLRSTKKNLILLTLCSILSNADAADQKNNGDTNIVIKVVEGRKVLTDSIEGKEIEAKLGNLRSKFENDIKKIDAELEAEVTELRSRARTVDQETLERDQERILRKKKERDSKAETSQEEFNRTAQRDLAKFNAKLQETIMDNAKKLNWDIVSLKETGEVIYVSDRANGTNEITKALDNKRKQEKAEHAKKVATPVPAA